MCRCESAVVWILSSLPHAGGLVVRGQHLIEGPRGQRLIGAVLGTSGRWARGSAVVYSCTALEKGAWSLDLQSPQIVE